MANKIHQPSITALRAFVAIAKHRHFGSAAEDLGVSQPTLSQALAGLESGLGMQLVERTTRRVFLTPEGERLLPAAIAAVDSIDELLAQAMGNGDPLAGTIRVGLIPTVAPYILPRVLRGVAQRLPSLRLQVVEDQTARLIRQLRDGSLDVALLALPTEERGLVEVPMYAEDFVLALPVGHPLAGRRRVDPASLSDLPLLLLDEGHCLRDQALEVCRLAGVRPDVGQTRAASLATAVQCVEGGLGVTLIPQTAVTAETEKGALATATFARPRPGRRIGLVFRESAGRADAYVTLAGILTDLVEESGAVRRE
ncbi:hydrogen peroxide-inducible genes activator [Gordonia rhizosphera]|uniref:Probable hydrogen peroxide-inducible genes activator n=1 Tax=Gordonia rhizosphera NBRC 16068 TaxID=1108045 RepID=K6W3N5_9ACTN|nr:hydrogen peroxide-inducible genes activator [Gordonia rhizosphera]GAB88301.1 putative oxidative stress response regulatory protein OxyR [Gordonia rhizosphera NBRC 16068]